MTAPSIARVAVIGAGAWGTALAMTAARASLDVTLWARNGDIAARLNRDHENAIYLPGIRLDPAIVATAALDRAAVGADAILLVVPTQHLRDISAALSAHVAPGTPVVLCSKGVEIGTGALAGEIVAATIPQAKSAVLSGPTFAAEVARGLPTAVTLAAEDAVVGRSLVAALGTETFRPYLSDDPVGCEIGGAVKNVLAIACGIVWGRGLGDNARAALVTRGLAEITRLALAKGARSATLMGLSGLGDLVLTCNAEQSRNCSLGIALGRGRALAAVLGERHSVAEGVTSARAVSELAAMLGVDMPIVNAVDAIIACRIGIDDAIRGLLARPFKPEQEIA